MLFIKTLWLRFRDLIIKIVALKVIVGVFLSTILLVLGKIDGTIWLGAIGFVIASRAYEKRYRDADQQ